MAAAAAASGHAATASLPSAHASHPLPHSGTAAVTSLPGHSLTFPSSSLPFPADLSGAALAGELAASAAACERVNVELESLMSQRSSLERALSKSVPTFLEQVEALRRAQSGVGQTVRASAASAQALSSKVRDLDLSASNVSAALQRVESVLALRHTIARVRDKLAGGALGSAADELFRALFVQQPIVNDLSFTLLIELERKVRDEVAAQALQRYVRQARNAEAAAAGAGGGGGSSGGGSTRASSNQQQSQSSPSALESKEIFRLARMWPKLGFNHRGLVMHCAQVRHECLAAVARSGWGVQSQVEGALIDYSRNVACIIDTCNAFIVQHLLVVQNTFGNGAQIRLIQELLTNVIDVEVAQKLLGRFMDERKIREPARGSNQPADDICSRIKQINQRIMAASNQRAGDAAVSYYQPKEHHPQSAAGAGAAHPSPSSSSSLLHIQRLDELLDELKSLAHDMENFLKGINSLARQSLDLLADAVHTEKEARDEADRKRNTSEAERNKAEQAFARILEEPQDLAALPSVHQQHDRVMTLLQRMLHADKSKKNLLGIPVVDDRAGSSLFAAAKPALVGEAAIPAAQLHLPSSSSFLISGFGLDPHLATSSRLYDTLLTLIGKYVLIEEYFMNVNVEKAVAIDEHDGANFADDDATAAPGGDDLEAELLAAEQKAKERERLAQAGGLHSLASAAMTSLNAAGGGSGGGVDPYLYLTGIGGALSGAGLPAKFVAKFATHKTSTLVDNVCFLYKKCVQRAIKTSNRDAIYSILLRVHENFNRKLRAVFEHSIAHYEARFGSKKKSSLTYALHANPAAYLYPAPAGGSSSNRANLLGAWVSSAASGMAAVGGSPSAQDVRRKVNGDVSLLLTVNNLDSTIENMQALLKSIDAALDDLFGDEQTAQGGSGAASATATATNYSRGLTLEQLREKVLEFHTSFFSFDQLINRGLQMVADNCWLRLLPRLAMLQTHATELYAQSDLSAASAEQSDLILAGYMEIFRRDVCGLAAMLSENNFYQLIFKLIKLTARFLEQLVLPKSQAAQGGVGAGGGAGGSGASDAPGRSGGSGAGVSFTQSGGVQFDKQVRTLTSFFTNDIAAHLERHFASNFFLYLQPMQPSAAAQSAMGGGLGGADSSASDFRQWRVSFSGSAHARQLFSRLGHIGSILSVERPAEVLDYTERDLFALSRDEVRRILSSRREFTERDIQQLKL